MDMTEEELTAPVAVKTLMDRIEASTARYKKDEARELHRAGCRTSGPLCRQTGEPMISYISRRRRWYKRLKQLDGTTVVSENILSDSLIDCAVMNEQEKLSVRTLAGDSTEFDVIATHIQKICRDIHTKETKRSDGATSTAHTRSTSNPRPRATFRALGRRGWQAKPPVDRPRFKPRSHFAAVLPDDQEVSEEDSEPPCAWTVVAGDESEEEEDIWVL